MRFFFVLGATRGLRRFDLTTRLKRLLVALPSHRAACMFFVLQTFCKLDKTHGNGTFFYAPERHELNSCGLRSTLRRKRTIANSSKKKISQAARLSQTALQVAQIVCLGDRRRDLRRHGALECDMHEPTARATRTFLQSFIRGHFHFAPQM